MKIYFDDELLNEDYYLGFNHSKQSFDKEFYLGSTASIEASLKIPKDALPTNLPNEVKVYIDNNEFLSLIIDNIEITDDEEVNINLTDKFVNLNVNYDISEYVPITAKNLLNKICTDFNINHDEFHFENENIIIESYDSNFTARDYLSMILEIAGGYGVIDEYGKLQIKYYQNKIILPIEYQEVEYIESTGTQYIDTGYVPTNTSGIYIKAIPTNTNDTVFAGCRESNSTESRFYIGSHTELYMGWNSNDPSSARPRAYAGSMYEMKLNYLNNRKRITNNTEYTPITTELTTQTNSIYIFAANIAGVATYQKLCKLYRLQITENNSIVKDFIPCYRKSDNEIGLYDLISETFFSNQGTGIFLKGDNIENNFILAENVESYKLGEEIEIQRIVYDGVIKRESDSDESKYTLYINPDNLFLQVMTDEEFQKICDKIIGFKFRNITISTINQVFNNQETIEFIDLDGNQITILNEFDSDYGGGFIASFASNIQNTKQEFTKVLNTPEKINRIKHVIDQQNTTISTITQRQDDVEGKLNEVETKQTATDYTISVISTNINTDTGDIESVKTINGFTFDSNGLNISNSESGYNAEHTNEGSFYRDGDSVLTQTTKDGTITKDLALYGKYYYGIDENLVIDENTNISEEAMFLGQLYTDNNNEDCFGHFYNGGN